MKIGKMTANTITGKDVALNNFGVETLIENDAIQTTRIGEHDIEFSFIEDGYEKEPLDQYEIERIGKLLDEGYREGELSHGENEIRGSWKKIFNDEEVNKDNDNLDDNGRLPHSYVEDKAFTELGLKVPSENEKDKIFKEMWNNFSYIEQEIENQEFREAVEEAKIHINKYLGKENLQIYLDNKDYFDKLVDVNVGSIEELGNIIKEKWGVDKNLGLDHIIVDNILYTMDSYGSDKEVHWGNKRTYKGITFYTDESRYSNEGGLNRNIIKSGDIYESSGFLMNDINYAD